MITAHGYATHGPGQPLTPWSFDRRDPGPDDIQIAILYTGICHTDLHQSADNWGGAIFPMVPGHEIVGRVTAVGQNVNAFSVGDLAAVGCMVDSDRTCAFCRSGREQDCPEVVYTYNARERGTGRPTYGGYADTIVVDQRFAVRVPGNLDLAGTAPLLCAGITMYSPLKRHEAGPGRHVGIVGLGGLGHVGVKIAAALGAEVCVITTSPAKAPDAFRLGADQVLISSQHDAMSSAAGSFDLLIDTIPTRHDVNPYLELLGHDATLVLVGALEPLAPVDGTLLIHGRRSITGSDIGGMADTQKMLDFCGRHDITADIELVTVGQINDAYQRLADNDVKYRFVIDMQTLATTT